MSPPADEPLFPCRWQHCAELFTSIRLLRHHLDDHAEVAPYVQLSGRKRRRVAEKGMWVVVPVSTSQGSHLASQAGNTTTTTTSTDPNTSASQALPLPPSFSSLPPRPIFSSPPASPPSPDPAQSIVPVQTQMPALTYNIDLESEREEGDYAKIGGKRKIFPFAAHSQLTRDVSLLSAQTHGDDEPEASNVHAPAGQSELDSIYPPLSPPTKRIAELADVALHEFLRSPSLQRPTAPEGERDEQEQDGSRSPFIPPTQAFQLLSSTPLDQFVMPGLGEDMEMDMSLESIRGIKRGEAEAQTDLPSPPRDTAHLDSAADGLDVSQLEPSIALEPLAVKTSSRADAADDDHLDPPSLYATPISSALPPVSKPTSPLLDRAQSPSRALLADRVQAAKPARTSSISAGLPMTFGSALPLPGSGTLRAKSLGGFNFGMGVMGGGSQGVRHEFGGTQGA